MSYSALSKDITTSYKTLAAIAALLFIAAVSDLPYEYYTFLKIIVFLTAGHKAYQSYTKRRRVSSWIWIIITIIFNPFILIVLGKNFWIVVDIATSMIFAFSAFLTFRQIKKENNPEELYLKNVENYIELAGGSQDLLKLQGSDKEYCVAVMRVLNAGFTAQTPYKVIGALILKSIGHYYKNRSFSIEFLHSLSSELSKPNTQSPQIPPIKN